MGSIGAGLCFWRVVRGLRRFGGKIVLVVVKSLNEGARVGWSTVRVIPLGWVNGTLSRQAWRVECRLQES